MLPLGDPRGPAIDDTSDRKARSAALHKLGRIAATLAATNIAEVIPESIEKGPAGEPLWPAHVVGSISHSGKWACAAVAARAEYRAIGIDLEQIQRRVLFDVAKRVCTLREFEFLMSLAQQEERDLWLKRIFSTKECVFKTLYPLCKTLFWFKDAELAINIQEPWMLKATLLRDLSAELPKGFLLPVSLVEDECHILSQAWLPAQH